MSELESVIEEKLIKQLTTGDSQWTYRPDLRTEEDLWNNIREKLNAYNVRKLEGHLNLRLNLRLKMLRLMSLQVLRN